MKKQKIKKIITIGLIATSLITVAPIKASAEWKKDSTGWWYTEGNSYVKDSWKQINGKWYHFDWQGYMETGWFQGHVSKLGANDEPNYYLDKDGSVVTGTKIINGVECHFDNNGKWLGFTDDELIKLTGAKQGVASIEYDNNDTTYYDASDGFHCKNAINDPVEDYTAKGYMDDMIYIKDSKKVLNGYVGGLGWSYGNYIENGKLIRNEYRIIGDKLFYFRANGKAVELYRGNKESDGRWYILSLITNAPHNDKEDKYYVNKGDGTDVEMTKDEYNKNIEENKIVFRGTSSAQGMTGLDAFFK